MPGRNQQPWLIGIRDVDQLFGTWTPPAGGDGHARSRPKTRHGIKQRVARPAPGYLGCHVSTFARNLTLVGTCVTLWNSVNSQLPPAVG